MVEKIKAVRFAFDVYEQSGLEKDFDSTVIAIAAALAEAEMMNERAEQAGAEWTRAREAWFGGDRDYWVSNERRRAADAILDQFFGGGEGTVNLDTNRVCRRCLHQYNDRVIHDCNDKEPK
jgi:hypothetical protein